MPRAGRPFLRFHKGYISLLELPLNVVRHSCWDSGRVTGTWTRNFLVARGQGNGRATPQMWTDSFLPSVPAVFVWATIGLESVAGCVGRLDPHVYYCSTNRGLGGVSVEVSLA